MDLLQKVAGCVLIFKCLSTIYWVRRITYAKFNAATKRVDGAARVYVTQELLDARIGERANQSLNDSFTGVLKERFAINPATRKSELELGHLGGAQFGFNGEAYNIVPIYWRVNRSEMKILEMQVARKVRETGKTVEWVVEAKYGAHPSIPEEIHVRAFVDGVRFIKEEIKNIP